MVREVDQRDLDAILELYLFLHQDSIPEKDEHLVCQDWWLCNYGECKQLHYVDMEDKPHPGYVDMIDELTTKFPLSEPQIVGEQKQKDFIALFGAILVIPVNTAFDTHVTSKLGGETYPLVSENTIHGQWLVRLKESGEKLDYMDERIVTLLKKRGVGKKVTITK